MASLVHSVDGVADAIIPELDDVEYMTTVLQLPADATEDRIDHDLSAKAHTLGISTPIALSPEADKRNTSSTESASTFASNHARTFSTSSDASVLTPFTTHSSLFGPSVPVLDSSPSSFDTKRQPKNLSFSLYDRYLKQLDPNIILCQSLKECPSAESVAKSIPEGRLRRRSLFSIRVPFRPRMRWKRKSVQPQETLMSCVCCRDDFNRLTALHSLLCGHAYCGDCLRVIINQAVMDESKMPPQCCTQPIPGAIIQDLLDRDGQQQFLKAVVQYSTPWESRIFCPNASCGEFIPPRRKVDLKHPFNVTCRKCRTRVCVMCKREAHPMGKDCPEDWELDDVLKMGEKSGWRRCYKCRNLVELAHGCTHMTCRCKAQFCYICGGVWDATVGCPNVCNGEEELERRRLEEATRMAEHAAEKAAQEAAAAAELAEREVAQQRTKNHAEFQRLAERQEQEMKRLYHYETTVKQTLRARHRLEKLAYSQRYTDLEEKMKDRHARTINHLEDRQIAAEMELRSSLEQSERSVRIRLKHMEAYCDGIGRDPCSDLTMPARIVTERDLRELEQQYNVRDGMKRLHEAKINVLRDRQTKHMEELLERHEGELEKLSTRLHDDLEDLAARFAHEDDIVNSVLTSRRSRLQRRWGVAVEVLQKELEEKDGVKYVLIPTPIWPGRAESEEG